MTTEDYTGLYCKILQECKVLHMMEGLGSIYFSLLLDELVPHVPEVTESTRLIF